MAMILQVSCNGQDCDVTDEFSAGVLEGNVCADLDPAGEGWQSSAGVDYCPRCARKYRLESVDSELVSEGAQE